MREFIFECVKLMDIHMWWMLPASIVTSVVIVYFLDKKGLL
jgi:hypothetical protein